MKDRRSGRTDGASAGIRREKVQPLTQVPNRLIEKARSGHEGAFRELVELYMNRIYAMAYQVTGNAADAQDITQEVFIKLYRTLDRYDPSYPFSTWLYRVTVNSAIDFMRKA
jgi:RNA polymerase sigma-70 factor (ECF subfamily)